jgi:hypothetical protein
MGDSSSGDEQFRSEDGEQRSKPGTWVTDRTEDTRDRPERWVTVCAEDISDRAFKWASGRIADAMEGDLSDG